MWHKGLSIGAVLKLLLLSICALILGFVIAMAIGIYVPKVVYGSGTSSIPTPGKTYTWQELEKAEKESDARGEEIIRQWRSKSFTEHVYDLKIHALWGVWLPWLLLPFVVRLRSLLHLALVLSVPIAGALVRLVPLEELLITAIAIAIGAFARETLMPRKHAT